LDLTDYTRCNGCFIIKLSGIFKGSNGSCFVSHLIEAKIMLSSFKKSTIDRLRELTGTSEKYSKIKSIKSEIEKDVEKNLINEEDVEVENVEE